MVKREQNEIWEEIKPVAIHAIFNAVLVLPVWFFSKFIYHDIPEPFHLILSIVEPIYFTSAIILYCLITLIILIRRVKKVLYEDDDNNKKSKNNDSRDDGNKKINSGRTTSRKQLNAKRENLSNPINFSIPKKKQPSKLKKEK